MRQFLLIFDTIEQVTNHLRVLDIIFFAKKLLNLLNMKYQTYPKLMIINALVQKIYIVTTLLIYI